MTSVRRLARCLVLMTGLAAWGTTAHAACTSPAGPEGSLNYNSTSHQFEFCDNTDTWRALGSSNALGDRITSGTLAMTANSATSYVSLSTNGTTWGYLNSGGSYLPTLTANWVSTTNVSATHLQLSSPTTVLACNSGFTGAMRYTSGTMQVCDGSNWGNIGIGVPTGTIAAFQSTSCPAGWSEYTASRGRFLRGYDNSEGNDPDGNRTPGTTQADAMQDHNHDLGSTADRYASGSGRSDVGYNNGASWNPSYDSSGPREFGSGGTPRVANETRPKNVAVIFCSYSGFQSAPGQTILTTLASLTDVSVAGATNGQVLTYSGGTWIASTTSGGSFALGDRITSGTHTVAVNTSSGYVSLSTNGTDWGYLGSGASFLPAITANRVSSTNVSATYLQLNSPSMVLSCDAGFTGAMRYTSGTMQVCDGSNWGNIGIGVPTGTIAAFAASSCPSGWSEYTAARGRFLRGIDNGVGIDPSGTRAAGNQQSDAMQQITGSVGFNRTGTGNLVGAFVAGGTPTSSGATAGAAAAASFAFDSANSPGARTAVETRPSNVAVTFCVYSGFQSAPGQTILTTLASLTDVSVAGASNGQVLTYSGGSWIASAPGGTPASNTGAIQFNVNNQLAGDTENLFWHNTNRRLGVGTATPGATVEISSSETLRLTKTGGTANNTYVSWIKDGVRQAYMGYGVPGSYFSINMENSNNLHIGGGSVGIGVSAPSTTLYVNGLIGGGFGSAGTAGVLDWDDISNARPGSGYTLLRGSTASNAPNNGDTAYFHPFSFEYSTKLGSGNLTQFAIPYSPAASLAQGMYVRGRTSGAWTGWYKFPVINPSGKMGINTNAPNAALDVVGTISATDAIQVGTSSLTCSSGIPGALRYNSGSMEYCNGSSWGALGGGGAASAVSSTGAIQFNAGSNNFGGDTANLFWNNATKRLGIGTATPSYPLDVNGVVQATSFFQSSDATLKANIAQLQFGLAVIEKLNPVTFDWKKDKKHAVGLIAQDVLQVIPTAVTSNTEGLYSVDYIQTIPYLIKGMQELKAANDNLVRANDQMSRENKMLLRRLEQLEKRVGTMK